MIWMMLWVGVTETVNLDSILYIIFYNTLEQHCNMFQMLNLIFHKCEHMNYVVKRAMSSSYDATDSSKRY